MIVRFKGFQFPMKTRRTSTMKSMIILAAIAAVISTGAFALQSGTSQPADTGAKAGCKCGENCKCDPCKCGKDEAVAIAGCKCGENCKCDPCECGKDEAAALAACPCPNCGEKECADCQCTDCQCPNCDCGKCDTNCPCEKCDCTDCKCGDEAVTADARS